MPLRAIEFYSGIGGLHLALKRSNVDAEVVRAFDWDQAAEQVYTLNHGPGIVMKTDIGALSPSDLPDNVDIWLLSPACQPYTVLNPAAKGQTDTRAQSFLHLITQVLPALARAGRQPRYMLVENVAGFEASSTRQLLLQTLRDLEYTVLELLLTPLQFGVPNSRLRYYLLAKRPPLSFKDASQTGTVWKHIPGDASAWVDPRSASTPPPQIATPPIAPISRYLYSDSDQDVHPCAVPDRVLARWGRLFDIVRPSATRTCCFTRGYTQMAERSGSVLQANEALDTTATFHAFLDAQARGVPDAVRTLDALRLRYFTPDELLRLFCFNHPEHDASLTPSNTEDNGRNFRWPADMSRKTRYRLIGNSVNVRVVEALVRYLFQEG